MPTAMTAFVLPDEVRVSEAGWPRQFNLTMRLYGPKADTLTGKWNPPLITKIQGSSSLMAQ